MKPLAALAAAMLAGCIFVPHTTSIYNPDCDVEERHMTLAVEQIAAIRGCPNGDANACGAALVALGAVAAASAVVSGSIVVVGNVVYWFERRGQCVRNTPVGTGN